MLIDNVIWMSFIKIDLLFNFVWCKFWLQMLIRSSEWKNSIVYSAHLVFDRPC